MMGSDWAFQTQKRLLQGTPKGFYRAFRQQSDR
jgi:hypothetical protein